MKDQVIQQSADRPLPQPIGALLFAAVLTLGTGQALGQQTYRSAKRHLCDFSVNLGQAAAREYLFGTQSGGAPPADQLAAIMTHTGNADAHLDAAEGLLVAPFVNSPSRAPSIAGVKARLANYGSWRAGHTSANRANHLYRIWFDYAKLFPYTLDTSQPNPIEYNPNCDSKTLDYCYHFGMATIASAIAPVGIRKSLRADVYQSRANQRMARALREGLDIAIDGPPSNARKQCCAFGAKAAWDAMPAFDRNTPTATYVAGKAILNGILDGAVLDPGRCGGRPGAGGTPLSSNRPPVQHDPGTRQRPGGSGAVYIVEVFQGAGFAGGLRDGDLVLELNGSSISTTSQLVELVQASPTGARLNFKVLRIGELRNIVVSKRDGPIGIALSEDPPSSTSEASPGKRPQDQREYELITQAFKETDPVANFRRLDEWKASYPQTAFEVERLQLYMVSYDKTEQYLDAVQSAKELLQLEPGDDLKFAAYATISKNTPLLKEDQQTLSDGESASRAVLSLMEQRFQPANKPGNVSARQWSDARRQVQFSAHQTLGWVAMKLKDHRTAEAEFTKALRLNPASAQVSYWLGEEVRAQRDPNKNELMFFSLARAASFSGPGALSPEQRRQVDDYLRKVYQSHFGSLQGLAELKELAKTQAFPPAGLQIGPRR